MSTYQTILVGTDGSITAGRAVSRAVRLATAMKSRLIVTFVGDTDTGRTVVEAARQQHADSGLEIETALLTGDPADAMIGFAEAEQVDLIVVGNKGMTGAQRFLLGSVPNKISHNADRDVLIVQTTPRRTAEDE
jgi:nucleotide-binding universal stress UspA family protein